MSSPFSIFAAADESPGRVALVAGGRTYTFAELAERTARVITWLGRRRTATARVALVASPSLETLLLVYALLETGVPAAFLHPRLTGEERARLAASWAAGEPLVLVEDAALELRETSALPAAGRGAPVEDEAPLGVLFTSGTTGTPKGVVLSRRAFARAAAASAANLGWLDDDRWLVCMPVAHVGGLSIVIRALLARRAVVLEPRFDPAAIAASITRERVSIVSLVPTMLTRLFEDVPAYRAPPALRVVMLGGAGAPARLLAEAAARDVPVLTTYGMTESCAQVTTQRYGTAPSAAEGSGPPLEGAELRIIDERIEVRGPTMFSGYWGEDPFPAGGWFRTTDFGVLDGEGRLHVRGRVGERIVTGGENVDPAEVEATIEAVPGVRAACVFGLPDDVWGEIVCVALVAEEPGSRIDVASLFRERLAAHKRPRRVAWIDALVVAPSGKRDRAATRAAAGPHLVPLGRSG